MHLGMGRAAAWVAVVCLAVTVFATPSVAYADVTYTITGGGWGHGIGLSQYGAQGYAKQGWPYADIVRWYYGADRDGSSSGVQVPTLSSLGHNANPYVNVDLDKSKATRASWTLRGWQSRLKVSDSAGTTPVYLTKDSYNAFTVSGGKVKVGTSLFSGTVTIQSVDATSSGNLVVVKDNCGPPLNSSYPNGYSYLRFRGVIRLTVESGKLRCVNRLPMEQYLYGVVPRESPSSFDADALAAQAVAARSYAWASNPPTSGTPSALSGNLYCTTSSQVYGGHSRLVGGSDTNISAHEAASTNAAVDATAGRIVYHAPTKVVVKTYFSSSSGGHTANLEDVWVTGAAKPYYKGVADADQGTSNYTWAPLTKTGAQLGAALRDKDNGSSNTDPLDYSAPSPATVSSVSLEKASSGYVRYMTVKWSNGASYRIPGTTFQSALGLKSSKFGVAVPSFGTRYEQTDSRISYVDTWSTYSTGKMSGGSYRFASRVGPTATVTFTGTGFRWIAPKAASYGKADVYLDGVKQTTVSLYSSTTKYKQAVWTVTGLAAGPTHKVQIVPLGTKDAASKGVYVGVDAFDIAGGNIGKAPKTRWEQNDSAVGSTGKWTTNVNSVMSSGSYAWSTSTAAWKRLYFTGTGVKWITATNSSYGKAWVYVDQRAPVLVDLYSAALQPRVAVYDSGTLPAGSHAIRIVPAGQKNASSTGTYVGVDAFDVR